MTIEIKTTETFDVDEKVAELEAASFIEVMSHRNNLYSSVNPIIVWNEDDVVKEARRISSEVKTVIDNLQNTIRKLD